MIETSRRTFLLGITAALAATILPSSLAAAEGTPIPMHGEEMSVYVDATGKCGAFTTIQAAVDFLVKNAPPHSEATISS